jgi:hypothetical protein
MCNPKTLDSIIVYNDDALKSPLIVVECKKPNATELEFKRALIRHSAIRDE